MNTKPSNFESLPMTITEFGVVQLGNLVEEYQLEHNLSDYKLAQLHMLLFAYYFETKNIIHGEIFNEIKIHFGKHSDEGGKFIKKAIKSLHETGSIGRNLNFTRGEFN